MSIEEPKKPVFAPLFAWCNTCGAMAERFDCEQKSHGLQWKVTCHGWTEVRMMNWIAMRESVIEGAMEAKFQNTCFEFRRKDD